MNMTFLSLTKLSPSGRIKVLAATEVIKRFSKEIGTRFSQNSNGSSGLQANAKSNACIIESAGLTPDRDTSRQASGPTNRHTELLTNCPKSRQTNPSQSNRAQVRSNSASTRQAGFSLVEVSIVTALMVILAIVGIPALQDYVIENKVPKVGADLQRFVARMKVASIGGSEAPFANVDRRVLVNGMRGSSAVTVRGEGSTAVVVHGLGGNGTADSGAITVAPAAVPDQPVGSAFSLTLDHVNHAACPVLATVLQRMASQVTVDGKSGEVVVKNDFNSPPMAYQPVLADAQCQRGDNNRFVFVFQ